MEFKVKDGQIIYYRDLGKGFPIVFLHGNNLSGNYFGKQGIVVITAGPVVKVLR